MALRPGFTLVEMLVVLVILGISSSIVIAALPRSESGAEAAASDYVSVLRRAQLTALNTGARVRASIQTDGSYRISVGPGSANVVDRGQSEACGDSIFVLRPTTYVMDPSGLVFGGTTTFQCADNIVNVLVENMEGRFAIAR